MFSSFIVFLLFTFGMISTIHLNNQATVPRGKICDIIPDNVLAHEINTHSTFPKMFP